MAERSAPPHDDIASSRVDDGNADTVQDDSEGDALLSAQRSFLARGGQPSARLYRSASAAPTATAHRASTAASVTSSTPVPDAAAAADAATVVTSGGILERTPASDAPPPLPNAKNISSSMVGRRGFPLVVHRFRNDDEKHDRTAERTATDQRDDRGRSSHTKDASWVPSSRSVATTVPSSNSAQSSLFRQRLMAARQRRLAADGRSVAPQAAGCRSSEPSIDTAAAVSCSTPWALRGGGGVQGSDAIRAANAQRIASMSNEERAAMLQSATELFGTATLSAWQNRVATATDDAAVAKVTTTVMTTTTTVETAALSAASTTSTSSHLDAVGGVTPSELAKRAWLSDVVPTSDSTSAWTPRFDLEGVRVTLRAASHAAETDDATSNDRALFHHGEEPGRAGYTVDELLRLAAATFPTQQATALSALAGVLRHRRAALLRYVLQPQTLDEATMSHTPFDGDVQDDTEGGAGPTPATLPKALPPVLLGALLEVREIELADSAGLFTSSSGSRAQAACMPRHPTVARAAVAAFAAFACCQADLRIRCGLSPDTVPDPVPRRSSSSSAQSAAQANVRVVRALQAAVSFDDSGTRLPGDGAVSAPPLVAPQNT